MGYPLVKVEGGMGGQGAMLLAACSVPCRVLGRTRPWKGHPKGMTGCTKPQGSAKESRMVARLCQLAPWRLSTLMGMAGAKVWDPLREKGGG